MMEIAGIALEVYLLVLVVSVFIGWVSNTSNLFGNLLVNAGALTLFFLFQRLFITLELGLNIWIAWLYHPLTIIVVVGYAIGTFAGKILQVLSGGGG